MIQKKLVVLSSLVATLSACGGNGSSTPPATPVPASVTAAQTGYKISVFAKAPGALLPDDLVQHGSNIFAVAQDSNNNPDGTAVAGTSPQSQVIEYDLNGNVVKTFNVPGHPDGIMEFDSHTVWVSTNEDANPLLIVNARSRRSASTWWRTR